MQRVWFQRIGSRVIPVSSLHARLDAHGCDRAIEQVGTRNTSIDPFWVCNKYEISTAVAHTTTAVTDRNVHAQINALAVFDPTTAAFSPLS